MTITTVSLTPRMSASNMRPLHMEPVALGDTRHYERAIPLMIPSSQIYFWERVWQDGEAESAAERKAGRGERFSSSGELIRWLLTPED